MQARRDTDTPVIDSRVILYRIVKQAAAIVVVVLVLKAFVADGFAIRGDQMAPSIVSGDRVLALRLPYLSFVRGLSSPSLGQPVIFSFPFEKKTGCLRVAGVSGDTVEVNGGEFKNSRDTSLRFSLSGRVSDTGEAEVIPPEFSARDFIEPFRVPAPGDTLALDSLGLSSFFWALTVIKQENPESAFSLQAALSLNDTLVGTYVITDFILYKGPIDSIPDSLRYDWHFWNHLKEYLRQAHRGEKASLAFSFKQDGARLDRYIVKKRFLFLLADNWNHGLDSRYMGPVACHNVVGRPFLVLWSVSKRQNQKTAFDAKRFGRIVR